MWTSGKTVVVSSLWRRTTAVRAMRPIFDTASIDRDGTHVAGIVAGRPGWGTGTPGVGPGLHVAVCKVFDRVRLPGRSEDRLLAFDGPVFAALVDVVQKRYGALRTATRERTTLPGDLPAVVSVAAGGSVDMLGHRHDWTAAPSLMPSRTFTETKRSAIRSGC